MDKGHTLLDDYMPEQELASELGVTTRTVARWRALDEGPPLTKIGRKNFYNRESAKRWLASREKADA